MEDTRIKLNEGARLPSKGSLGAAGHDLYSSETFELQVGERKLVKVGISTAIPEKYEAQIRGRSGLTLKGIDVPLGTIDSDYRGEWGVILVNNSGKPFQFKKGDRIAQAVFNRVSTTYFSIVQELDYTVRGEGGFGSTGISDEVTVKVGC